MKKIIKVFIVFIIGCLSGYYICDNPLIIFNTPYMAFEVGVYTNKEAANTIRSKYNSAIVVKDDELYRVYVSILKDETNIDKMSKYLKNNNVDFYKKEISISDINVKNKIDNYERIMNNNSEVVFLELNKLIIESFEGTL